jgi:hypothetical protein
MKFVKFLLIFSLICYSCKKSDDPINDVEDVVGIDDDTADNNDNDDNQQDDDNNNPPANMPPEIFNLLSVNDTEQNVELIDIELSWEVAIDPDGDVVTYDVIFEQNSETPSLVVAENLTEPSFQLASTLLRNTSYAWQVIARDSKGASTASAVFSFMTKPITIAKLVNDAEFDGRSEHATVIFDDRIWIIGGFARFEVADDVWSSRDGINWIKETNNAGFISRGSHTCVVFKNKIWIIGGLSNSGEFLNDVWSSSDGVNWIQENIRSGFRGGYNHTAVIYDDKIWLIGGQDAQNEFNDVWFSKDGVNWQLATSNPGFPSRNGQTALVFNDRIFILGGINSYLGGGFGALNDVWSSADGVNWQLETIDAEFSPRWGHSSVVFENEIWLFGGLGSGRKNDIWSTKDGVNWKNESPQIPYAQEFSARFSHTTDTFQNRILMLGGNDGSVRNDIINFE